MSTFVEVPAEVIRAALAKAGFMKEEAGRSGGEEVWTRAHDRSVDYMIKVYTSLTRGAGETRDCGTDAIRVCVLKKDLMHFPARWTGCWKSKRVHRTGSPEKVVERMLERAREAYAFVDESLAKDPVVVPAAPVAPKPVAAAPLAVSYTKLRDGSWGVRVEGLDRRPAERQGVGAGQTVTVTKKNGETKQETIARVLWTGEGVALCTIVSDTAPSGVAPTGHDVTGTEKKV